MIVFDLRCASQGHVFEGWFGSSEDYASQAERGLVSCPICGAPEVEKAPMAPRVGKKGNQQSSPDERAAAKAMLAQLAKAQRKLLEKSDFVGDRFPDEARAIHLGESEARAIHGRATRADAESLIEDGIPVSPLLFPVPEPGEEN
ncbi:DUF1178 family protein [Sphingosinicella sp. CPCC 101087]|uniref:DUF1178 family protein n=1 Tax=Sphingosinicella sp. CPCC 101087 TaxID=2497754 RepID=UPI00101BFDE1|nr:DUF1178 family protein [Sphingosinicella sp. CPCC 101087]